MSKKKIYVIVGESGSGKSTIAKEIVTKYPDMELLITTTTRPIRPNEVDGIDYIFTDDENFNELIKVKRFVEHSVFNNWGYGLQKDTILNSKSDRMIVVLNPQGLKSIINYMSDEYDIIPFYIHVEPRIRLIRCLQRDCDVDEIIRRYGTDKIDFEDITKFITENNGHIIKNTFSLEYAINQIVYAIELGVDYGN